MARRARMFFQTSRKREQAGVPYASGGLRRPPGGRWRQRWFRFDRGRVRGAREPPVVAAVAAAGTIVAIRWRRDRGQQVDEKETAENGRWRAVFRRPRRTRPLVARRRRRQNTAVTRTDTGRRPDDRPPPDQRRTSSTRRTRVYFS